MNIDREEVLRYLGYKDQDIDKDLNNLIDDCIDEAKAMSKALYTYKIFEIEPNESKKEINVLGTSLTLRGNDIYEHLKDAKKCAIMAATLGVVFDNKVRILERFNMTKALILDSCGTDCIEKVCDEAEKEIKKIAMKEGFITNYRYSPGYGDLSIDVQQNIINILNANKIIGLTTTESCILLPRKSVTAIIGFVDKNSDIVVKKGCEYCSKFHNCLYRRDGVSCGSYRTN